MTIQKVTGMVWDASDNLGYVNLSDLVAADGVTDAAPFILATLTAGSVLYVPPGTFVSTGIVFPANSQVFGAGDKSVIKLKDGTNTPLVTLGSGSKLRNFRVDGNKANQTVSGSHGILVTAATDSHLEDVSVINAKGDGINVAGVSAGVSIKNSIVTGCTVNGIRIESGSNIALLGCITHTSDAAASGDGIAVSSAGLAVDKVTITGCISRANVGRGISMLGSGSRNVTGVTISNCNVSNNSSHGIHAINAEACSITGGSVTTNTLDGIRFEGDVQYCRVAGAIVRTNVVFGVREVISGSTPNNNGFTYIMTRANGNDVVTIVGGASFKI